MARLAFLGRGLMGAPMATPPLQAHHDVTVWNRTSEKTEPLVERGAPAALSPARVAAMVDVAITVVGNPQAQQRMGFGGDGLPPALRPGKVLIDMSTVGPDAARSVAARLPHSVGIVDAPVRGSVSQATQDQVAICAGATQVAFERVQLILMALGAVHHVGSQDQGRPRKWSSIPPSVRRSRRSAGPSPWATRSGWTHKTLLGVLAESPDGMTVSGKRADVESGTYPPNFTLSLALEDLHLATGAAERAGRRLELAWASQAWLERASGDGTGDPRLLGGHRDDRQRPRKEHAMTQAGVRRVGALATVAALAAVSLLASGCTWSSARSPVSLPVPKTGGVTFYLSLPASTTSLSEAAAKVATPGSSDYRHFRSLDKAARQFGATDAQINTVAKSVQTLGLQFAADPTRLFGRVTGSTEQWQAALGSPLSKQAATASSPFITYSLPAQTPAALQPSGTSLLLPETQVYDPTSDGGRPPSRNQMTPSVQAAPTATPTTVAEPWPFNTGTPLTADCSAPLLQQRRVYTQQQVQTAYGIDALRTRASGTPVITILDLGSGWLPNDLKLAGQCFGYSPKPVSQTQGDGVVTAIENADGETSLDVQTAAAVAPGAQLRLVQSTVGGLLDAFSRALGDPGGLPDVISLSYGGCALAENRDAPEYTSVIDAALAMTALTGVSSFVAAGDSGSTTCGTSVRGTTVSYPAVSSFVTAVGGTRLILGTGNTRVSETVWNDSIFGVNAAGGGGLSRRQPRPAYQDGANPENHRAVPDVSALADIVPGWPLVINSTLQTVGGTSGSTPFTAAATALVVASERTAGRPPVGLANGWFYNAASRTAALVDVTTGGNDLAGVGCCQATVGYDLATGLGVPNWATLPAALPPPG